MLYHILLVDDDPDFRYEFRELMSDFDVIEAHDADEAIKILKKANQVDLIILDERLPGTKGTVLLKDIKQIAPTIPTIILTGYSTKDVAIDALRGDAKDFIEKPLNLENIEKIKEYLLSAPKGENDRSISGTKGKIERAKYFVERNHNKKLTLQEVAREVCLSPKYLSRIFKESTGMGFSDYKLQLRIKKAKELLKDTGDNIEEISHKLGYENPESFIRIFREYTDMSPRQFRDKNFPAKRGSLNGKTKLQTKRINVQRTKEKQLRQLGNMATKIAQELRDPLSIIQTATTDMKKTNKDRSLEKNIRRIEKMADESGRLVDNILNYTTQQQPASAPSQKLPPRKK